MDEWIWSMRKLFWVLFAVSPFLIVGMPFSLIALATWEPSDARLWSLAYILAIPSSAKNFPLWEPCGLASYSSRMQDGPAPETYWISYKTQLSKTALENVIEGYVRTHNCKFSGNPQSLVSSIDISFTCGPSSPEIQILASDARDHPTCLAVTITFVEKLI